MFPENFATFPWFSEKLCRFCRSHPNKCVSRPVLVFLKNLKKSTFWKHINFFLVFLISFCLVNVSYYNIIYSHCSFIILSSYLYLDFLPNFAFIQSYSVLHWVPRRDSAWVHEEEYLWQDIAKKPIPSERSG